MNLLEARILAELTLKLANAGFSMSPDRQHVAWEYEDTRLAATLITDHTSIGLRITNGDRALPTMLVKATDEIDELIAILTGEIKIGEEDESNRLAREAVEATRTFKLVADTMLEHGYKKLGNHDFGLLFGKEYAYSGGVRPFYVLVQNHPTEKGRLKFTPTKYDGSARMVANAAAAAELDRVDHRRHYTSDTTLTSINAAIIANDKDNKDELETKEREKAELNQRLEAQLEAKVDGEK